MEIGRFKIFLMKLKDDMRERNITQKDISEKTGLSESTITSFFSGKSLTKDTLNKVIDYIDNPKNWNKIKKDMRKKENK